MNSQMSKGPLAEVKKINSRSIETTLDLLNDPRTYDDPRPISTVNVEGKSVQDTFHSTFIIIIHICYYLLLFIFVINKLFFFFISIFIVLYGYSVLVDDCVYGPFRRICIRPCELGTEPNQPILTIPVMTHLPIPTI